MTKEALKEAIDVAFETRRDFIRSFNAAAEADVLNETTLSRQIHGHIAISGGFVAAYVFFFTFVDLVKTLNHEGKQKQNA